jgi:hypothetical protein
MSSEEQEDGKVGYGRPPKATRFASGKSGNPSGRPRGSQSVALIFKTIMSQKVNIAESGRTRRISRMQLILLRLANDAARGDPRAIKLALELNDRYGQPSPVSVEAEKLSVDDLEILAAYSKQWQASDVGLNQDQKDAEGSDDEGA